VAVIVAPYIVTPYRKDQMVENIIINNSSNHSLAGVIHKPNGPGPFPAVLVLHGYLASKDEAQIVAFAQALSKAGFLALRFDAYGVNDSGGTIEEDYRVSQIVKDTECWYEYLSTRSDVDSNKIGICGHSLGASMAIIYSAMNHQVSACCAVQPCTKVTRSEGKRRLSDWTIKGYFAEELGDSLKKRRIKMPVAFGIDADNWDAAHYASKVRCPMMLMFGEDDIAVTPETVQAIYKLSPPETTQLIRLEKTDHDFKYSPEKLDLVTTHLVQFMASQLYSPQHQS